MTIEILKNKLEENHISKHAYSLFGDGIGECYVITKEQTNWLVYYSERGERRGVKFFQKESDACDYFLEKILSDPTTKR